jgi:hypothetical protein
MGDERTWNRLNAASKVLPSIDSSSSSLYLRIVCASVPCFAQCSVNCTMAINALHARLYHIMHTMSWEATHL